MNSFGQIITAVRAQKGLTLTQMARRCRTHKGYVSGIENGKVSPPAAGMTRRFAHALKLDPLDLIELGWSEKAPKDIRERVQKRLLLDNPLFLAVIPAPQPAPEVVIPDRKVTA